MKTLGERLKKLLELRKMNLTHLAREIGISQTAVSNIISGKTKRAMHLLTMCKILDCDPFWLALGEGIDPTSKIKTGKAPVIPWDKIKEACIDLESLVESDTIYRSIVGHGGTIKTFALQIYDDSMTSSSKPHSFSIGEFIFVDPSIKPEINDFVIAYKEGGYPALRQYLIDAEGPILKAFNGNFRNISIDDKTKILAVVIGKSDVIK